MSDRTRRIDDSVSGGGPPDGPELGPLRRGDTVGTFEIRSFIDEGATSCVYVARDKVLGRRVALKLIRHGRLEGRALQRFLDEARATASLNHPNIVVLHTVGEHDGRPYFALEYLPGTSLKDRIAARRPSVPEALRFAAAIASALDHAHRHAVMHCDLKPANIVIPEDGRLRVVDFGMAAIGNEVGHSAENGARNGVPSSSGLAGTPVYMAPEQWQGEPLTIAVDIWALGIILFELLEGKRPFDGPGDNLEDIRARACSGRAPLLGKRPELDPRVTELIQSCLERSPKHRPNAREVLQKIEAIVGGASALPRSESPFRGLQAFDESSARFFFGREDEVSAFVERARGQVVLPIVGPSGTGKSSFVRAGVIPRLREEGPWVVLNMRPGQTPLRTFAERLVLRRSVGTEVTGSLSATDFEHARELEARLRESPQRAHLELHDLASKTGARVLLFIDQMEETCTQTPDLAEQRAFLEAVTSAADDVEDPVRVIFTLRDDFLGRLAVNRPLDQVTIIHPMRRDQLRRTIVRPLERTEYSWEDPATVEKMLSEVEADPGGLPLLQFACRSLWDQRDEQRAVIPASKFLEMGGVAGALARHADAVIEGLTPEQARITRSLLLALVNVDFTRRSASREALVAELGTSVSEVIERLREARLLMVRRVSEGGRDGAMVELVHESLITRWAQLGRWMHESHDERIFVDELEKAAELWERRKRPDEEVWIGDALRDAKKKILQLGISPSERAKAFLAAGTARAQRLKNRTLALWTGALAVFFAVVAAGIYTLVQANLASADVGVFDLSIRTFDLDESGMFATPVDPAELPELSWRLYSPDRNAPDREGRLLEAVEVEHLPATRTGTAAPARVDRVEARAGAVFLEVSGRGRRGESCASTWIHIRALPGYAERDEDPPLSISVVVPTCRATLAGMKAVPAGPFMRAGVGEPPIKFAEDQDPERELFLPSFRIDRTEVSNAAYDQFASMHAATGIRRPDYPTVRPVQDSGKPNHPVSNVDSAVAAAYCRFMGKRLPSTEEWEKAARGGLTLDAARTVRNSNPRRNLPWGDASAAGRANLKGAEDGWEGSSPVDAFPEGASPYGVLNMAGNVYEWTASRSARGTAGNLVIIRGGDWESHPREEDWHFIAYENVRDARYFLFSIGFRCAASGD